MSVKLYIENLPTTMTDASLTAMFAKSGAVTSVDLVKDPSTGRAQGHAFVVMVTEAEAKDAVHQLNGMTLEGHRLTVTHASATPPHRGFSGRNTAEERKNR